MAEAAVAAAIDRLLKQRGAYVINLHNSGHGRNGVADRVAVYRGRALVIEIKQPGGRADKAQRYELAKARLAGAVAIVADRAETVALALDAIDQKLDNTETFYFDGAGVVQVLGYGAPSDWLDELGVASIDLMHLEGNR